MDINHSVAYRYFKKEIGQANHMLITIMIGLEGIIDYDVKASPEFHVAWNPKSKSSSVQRSKIFAKKASLAWLVNCLEMYLRLINQNPILICKDDLKCQIDNPQNSRSIYRRISLICNYCKIQSIDYALVDLLICWRNRLTHFQAENNILESHRKILLDNAMTISESRCHLDVVSTLKSFDQFKMPTFKEVTTFVKASINLISEVDKFLLNDLGMVAYADKIIISYLSNDKINRLDNVFSKDNQTAEKTIRQVLSQNGFTLSSKNDVDIYCKSISQLSYKEAKQKLTDGTFISGQ